MARGGAARRIPPLRRGRTPEALNRRSRAAEDRGVVLRALALLWVCVGIVGCAHGQDGYYTMQRGDTLYSVSRQVGVPVEQIVTANGIDDVTDVPIGTRLRVPGTQGGLRPLAPAVTAAGGLSAAGGLTAVSPASRVNAVSVKSVSPASAGPRPLGGPAVPDTYRMVKGDTVYSIAARFSLDPGDLMERNDIDDPSDLPAGTVLTLGGVARRTAAAAAMALDAALLWPTDGEPQPLTGKIDGVAIRGAPGQPVRSVSSGTVTWSGPHRGFGYVVLVRNDRYVYGYLNNRQVQVEVGDRVQVGSPIGQLGVDPHDNTAQLYFVVLKDGRYVDPRSAPRA